MRLSDGADENCGEEEMTHRWDCPTESEARSRGRSDADFDSRFGYGKRYGSPFEGDCDSASRHYRNEYDREFSYQEQRREEEAMQRRAAERARQRQEEENEYWRQQEEEDLYRRLEAEQNEEMQHEYENEMFDLHANQLYEDEVELPRWADDGGPESNQWLA